MRAHKAEAAWAAARPPQRTVRLPLFVLCVQLLPPNTGVKHCSTFISAAAGETAPPPLLSTRGGASPAMQQSSCSRAARGGQEPPLIALLSDAAALSTRERLNSLPIRLRRQKAERTLRKSCMLPHSRAPATSASSSHGAAERRDDAMARASRSRMGVILSLSANGDENGRRPRPFRRDVPRQMCVCCVRAPREPREGRCGRKCAWQTLV